jgi:hypothetical protein
MEKKLLAIGGREVVWPDEPDFHLSLLLNRGQVFDGKVRLRRDAPDQPHANAAKLWALSPESCHIVTGYALGGDGIWARHSWVIEGAIPKRRDCLLETTQRRTAYFGYPLAHFEAIDFWIRHFLWAYGEAPLKMFYRVNSLAELNRCLDQMRFGPSDGPQRRAAPAARRGWR